MSIAYSPFCAPGQDSPTQGLYVLSIPGNYWKIGIAFDAHDRIRQLQCGCPEKISLECFYDTEADGILASRMEKELHLKLSPYRTHGEWFHLPIEVLAFSLKEIWMKLRYPEIYERLTRFRSHKRVVQCRRQAEKRGKNQ